MDVRPNDDFSLDGNHHGSDKFLYFPYTVEVVSDSDQISHETYIECVATVMKALYRAGMEVVAACTWEDELPGGGRLLSRQ